VSVFINGGSVRRGDGHGGRRRGRFSRRLLVCRSGQDAGERHRVGSSSRFLSGEKISKSQANGVTGTIRTVSWGGETGLGSRIIECPYETPLPLTRYGDSDSLVGDCEWPSGRLDGWPCDVP
jgi:hypothetical protein